MILKDLFSGNWLTASTASCAELSCCFTGRTKLCSPKVYSSDVIKDIRDTSMRSQVIPFTMCAFSKNNQSSKPNQSLCRTNQVYTILPNQILPKRSQ